MSMFYKGDFAIKDSWGGKEDGEKGPVPAQKKPTTPTPPTGVSSSRPSSTKIPASPSKDKLEKKPSSIMNAAAKNLVGGSSISAPKDKIDDDLARRLIKNLQMEGYPGEGIFPKGMSPVIPGVASHLKKPPSSNNGARGSAATAGDSDLLTSMAGRLQKSEQLMKNMREEIKDKSREIEGLKTEVEIYKQSGNSEQSADELRKLKKDNLRLLEKTNAMEKFLADFGLRWTVEETTGDEVLRGELDKAKIEQYTKKPKYNYPLPSEIDFNVIMRRIDELNFLIEKEGGCQEVYKDDRGFNRIRRAEPIPIGFYSDGIAIKGHKFYKYGTSDNKQILADILEGYFPYQLKKEYPNGIQLKVIDRADEAFNPEKKGIKNADIHSIEEDALKPMSKEEFLSKIPKQVIRDGKIIAVREGIQKKLDGGEQLLAVKEAKKELLKVGETAEEKTKKRFSHEVIEEGNIRVLTEEYKI